MNQKIIFLAGAVCMLVLVAGYLSVNWGETVSPSPENSTNENDLAETENTLPETPTSNETGVSGNVAITLNSNSINADNNAGVIIDGKTLTITSAGNYSISGTLNDGQIIVDTNDEGTVTLVLAGTKISSSTGAPLFVEDAKKTVIFLAENTENILIDSQNNPNNATISSKDDLIICGKGMLTVTGNANDAIRSNDGLVIEGGSITVTSVDDGLRGKDYLIINGGKITVNSVGDGLKSDNNEDPNLGYISITNGEITVVSTQGDAISAQTNLTITDGTFKLTSGGGSTAWINENLSTKGLKAGVSLVIDSGQFSISSSDDSLHSNDAIQINGGTFNLASGDDAVHADTSLEINDGIFDISQSYEGLESTTITINGGDIQITASDDGINVAGGNTGNEDFTGGRPRWGGGFEQTGDYYIYINGGTIYIDSGGDGLDSNGYIEMTNGLVVINGPTSNMNAAIDYGGGTFQLTGGTILAVGSAGMAQAPSSTTQNVASLQFNSPMSGDVLVHIQTESGEKVITFSPTKTYQSLVFCSPDLKTGTYNVYFGGSSTGTAAYGLYEGGTYTGGTEYGSFTIT